MNPIQRLGAAFKAFSMQWASAGRYVWWSGMGSRRDYQAEVGDGRDNSIVVACALWFCRNFPEAPIRVSRLNREGEASPVPNHPLKLLLDTPNPFYPGELLWWATCMDWLFGDAYWLKVRSGMGRPVELWWVPEYMIEPRWPDDGSVFISHYDYTPNGQVIRIETQDIVHLMNGMDPKNPRKGYGPIKALMRELYIDEMAADYSATMLRNVGVPPVVLSPSGDARPTQEELEEVKNGWQAKTTGSQRGQAMVMRGPTDVKVLAFNPSEMNLRELRGIPEERVSAEFGIPAAVVGLGSGLANTKVGATMAEMREQAYDNAVIPGQRLMAAQIRTQLLPEFGSVETLRVDFDLSEVRVLQEDENAKFTRLAAALAAGGILLNEYREQIGLKPLPDGDVLYIPGTVTPTDPAELLAEPEPVPLPVTVEEVPGAAAGADAPALPPPAKVRPLPLGKARKASDNIGPAVDRLRTRLQARAERDLAKFFRNQAERLASQIDRAKTVRTVLPDPEEWMRGDDERLRIVLERLYTLALEKTHGVVEDVLGTVFDLDDPLTRAYLAEAGVNIAGIHEETLTQVRAALREGQVAGESIGELAVRFRDLPAFNQARAQTVARTELAHATNLAAIHGYRASGLVVGVLVRDGDYDEACRQMDGRTFRLEDAPPTLAHPRCLRAFLPVTDVSEMESAA